MNQKDLRVISKVRKNFADYEWETVSADENYHSIIDYPAEVKRSEFVYMAEVKRGLIIITGTFYTSFYYDEGSFTWEKKYFCSIISSQNKHLQSIAFITDEDYENMLAKNELLKINLHLRSNNRTNLIRDLYDCVNRKVNDIDSLYDDFLEEEE
ncbi:hypothetical protein MJ3_11955 [Salimicrobium jeotgali]|nr:hypothetical protein [Salimicrobium jeotgali]EKE30776.1 hypothetical protein MJ3_11955 [Salimicrobium jeotgali]MBM7697549.1 hypothetical protein [Salimicrobium jeotgali]